MEMSVITMLKKALGLWPKTKESAQHQDEKEMLDHLVDILTLSSRDLKNFMEIINNDCCAGILDSEDRRRIHNQYNKDILRVSEYAEEAMLRSGMPYPISSSETTRYFRIALGLLGIYQSAFQYITYIDLGFEYNPGIETDPNQDEQLADLFWSDNHEVN